MAGLADIFNDKEALQSLSSFLLGFGRDLSAANQRGFSPLASVAFGFSGAGGALGEFREKQQLAQLRAAQVAKAKQEAEDLEREQRARQFLAGSLRPEGQLATTGLSLNAVPVSELPSSTLLQAAQSAGISDTEVFNRFLSQRRGLTQDALSERRFERGVFESDRSFDESRRQFDEQDADRDRAFSRGVLESDRSFVESRRQFGVQQKRPRSDIAILRDELAKGHITAKDFARAVSGGSTAFLDKTGNLKPAVSRAIASNAATLVGGGFDALGNPIGLTPQTSRQALQIQTVAAEELRGGRAGSISEALQTAVDQVLGESAPREVAAETAPTTTERVPAGTEIGQATGVSGFAGNIANIVSDALGLPLVAPETDRAIKVLDDLRVTTRLALAQGVSGRPSNLLLEAFDELAVTPASLFQGDQRSLNRLEQTRNFLTEEIAQRKRLLETPERFTEKQVAESRAAVGSLEGLVRAYDAAINQFGETPGQSSAPIDAQLTPDLTAEKAESLDTQSLKDFINSNPEEARKLLDDMPEDVKQVILRKFRGNQ